MKMAFISQEGKTAVTARYEKILEDLSVPCEQIFIPTRYGSTFALTAGKAQAQTVILLHGSSMNSAMWLNDIAALSYRYRVIALDIPGEPGKSNERQLPLDSDDYACWLSEVLSVLKIQRTVLIGNSLGAWIALKFSVLYPEAVEKLVLLAPAGIGSQNPEFAVRAMELLPKGDAGVTELLTEINGGAAIPEGQLEYQKLIASVFNGRQEIIPLFTDQEIKRLSMPCAVFLGGKDIMIRSHETRDRLLRLIPHCIVKMYPEKGHSITGMEQVILDFLQSPS